MNHRVIIVAVSVLIVAAIVGGVVYVEWPERSASQVESVPQKTLISDIETMQEPATATSSLIESLPQPVVGPPVVEAQPALGIMGTPRVHPLAIIATETTSVTVEIEISDPALIPTSVNLQRLDATGKVIAVLGSLIDNGTNGDLVAGDKMFSIQRSFTEPTPGTVRLQVSAAFQGLLKRVAAAVFVLDILPLRDPEAVLDHLVIDLRTGDIESVLEIVPSRNEEDIRSLDSSGLNSVADYIASRQIVRATQTLRVYAGKSRTESGELIDREITLSRLPDGRWRIVSW